MDDALLLTEKSAGSCDLRPPTFLQAESYVLSTVTHKAEAPPAKASFRGSPGEGLSSRPDHGAAPSTCEVRWSSRYGRFLVTSRDVSAGEVLFQERPMLVVPKVGSEAACLSCLALLRDEWTGCRRCGGPMCSAECLGSHHSTTECSLLQRMGFKQAPHIDALIKDLNVIIGPLRLLLLIHESPPAKNVFLCLESHTEKRRKLPIGKFVEEHIAGGLHQRLGLDLSSEIVHRLCGVLDTNSFEVNLENSGRGRAIFAIASMMNHSCVPNAQWGFSQGRIIVRATVDILKDRPVLINYTQTLWGTQAREIQLVGCKMFKCTCQRCLDPTELGSHLSSVRCRACKGVLQLPAERHRAWECHTCGNTVASDTVEAMVRAGATALTRLQEEDAAVVAATAVHLSRVLGPQHYIVAQAKYCFLEALFRSPLSEAPEEQLSQAVDAARQLMALVQLLEPGVSRLRGLLLYYETAAAAELLQRGRGSDCDMETVEILLRQSEEVEMLLEHDRLLARAIALSSTLRNTYLKKQQH